MLLQSCGSATAGLGFHTHDNRGKRLSSQHRLTEAQLIWAERARRLQTLIISRGTPWACNEEACLSSQDSSSYGVAKEERSDETAVEAPLLNALRECAQMDAAAFHFPGHRRGAGAPPLMAALVGNRAFAADLPELPELDNLHAAEGVIYEAQRKAARLFGADQTWFLVNGSTCGIQAAVMATCAPGDYLILPRNVHMSAVTAMVLSGALPKYLTPTADSTWGVGHCVRALQVRVAIDEVERAGGRVGAVLIVSPTYFGVCSLIADVAQICHSHDLPLIIDEAHGAHFRFHNDLPQTALEQGADIAVQSTHKVLGSLTQSGMLHAQGTRIARERVSQSLQMLQSSSPSYLLLASLDASRAHMEANCQMDAETGLLLTSDAKLHAALSLAIRVRTALQQLPGLEVLDMASMAKEATTESSVAGIDPLRITVGLWKLGLTGFEADDILRLEHGVVAELPSLRSITFAITAGSSRRDATRLIDSFASLSTRYASRIETSPSSEDAMDAMESYKGWENWAMVLSPREAFYATSEKVEAKSAVGRVSSELVCVYPPGIPVVTPGEILTREAVECVVAVVAQGGMVSGASDASFEFARVVVNPVSIPPDIIS